ncbi:MAG TPA: S8 family serine peptidase [Bacillota bacterium]|nr:S8 family serine peptidase [Bacillota bacterium]
MGKFLKPTIKYLSLLIVFALFILLLPAVRADNPTPVSNGNVRASARVIIVAEHKSGAVIYQSNQVYYYGLKAPASSSIINQGEIKPGEIIIKFKNNRNEISTQSLDSITQKISKFAVRTSPINGKLGLALVQLRNPKDYFSTLQELNGNPEVEYAEPNYVAHASQIPNDSYYSQQWGPKDIHADLAWDKVSAGQLANVTIAVLDTGINVNHEDLQSNLIPGYNMMANNANPMDGNGHGTHVAGIAAAIVNNGKGIAGIAGGAKIMPVKVLDDSGSGSYSNIINGIKYAADHGANVISMSLGGQGFSQAMQDAVSYAMSRGVTVVAAAGNDNGPVNFPGNCSGVITVGAVSQNNQRASFSSYGPEMDVMAPGVSIVSSYIGSPSNYTTMSGTSMATPFVSGVAALVKAANPKLLPADVAKIINQAAVDLGTPGFDNYYGYGLVNADRAVDLARGSQSGNQPPTPTPPAPTPSVPPTPTPVTGINLALHKKGVASSVEGSARTADQAFDGNLQTRWASQAGVDPQYIYVDLGKPFQINKIILTWETAFAKTYQLYVSNDGQNWTSLYYTANGTGGVNSLNVSGQGRYVLLYGLKRGTQYGYSLWEFEVYGR